MDSQFQYPCAIGWISLIQIQNQIRKNTIGYFYIYDYTNIFYSLKVTLPI